MAFGGVVQSIQGSAASGESTATFASGATSGNLIIYAVSYSQTVGVGGAWNAPSGFTGPIHDIPVATGNLGCAWWYKISTGGETTVTTTITNEAGNYCSALVEIEGPFAAVPLDAIAENQDNISAPAISQTSGTTATTAQNDEVALAFFGADNGSNILLTRTYTNSFTEVIFANSGARASAAIAIKVLSATGAVECTFATLGTGDEMYGSMATFKKLIATSNVNLLSGKLEQKLAGKL